MANCWWSYSKLVSSVNLQLKFLWEKNPQYTVLHSTTEYWTHNAHTNTLYKWRIDTKAIFSNNEHQGNHINYTTRKHHCRMGTLPQFKDIVLITPERVNDIPNDSNYKEVSNKQIKKIYFNDTHYVGKIYSSKQKGYTSSS